MGAHVQRSHDRNEAFLGAGRPQPQGDRAEADGIGHSLVRVQWGLKSDQKKEFGRARYGWNMLGGKLGDLLARLP